MTPGAVIFMLVSWGLVLGLTAWAFGRILTHTPPARSTGKRP